MQRNIHNKDCRLYHTPQCDLLNMPSCDECIVNDKADDAELIQKDLDILAGLLPEGGVSPLFDTDECVLCKGEKNKRAVYGLLDLGHAEPKREKRSILGLKVRARVGSLLPVQLSVCKACKRRLLILDYLPAVLPVIVGLAVILVFMLPGITASLERTAPIMPFALFVVSLLLAAVLGSLLSRTLAGRYSKHMHLDVFELPLLNEMKENGWFSLSTTGKKPRLIFVKNRMRMGVGTGTPEDSTC